MAAFLEDAATQLIDNPFPSARAAAARSIWAGRGFDLRAMGAELAALPASEPLIEEVARSGPHTASVFLSADRGRVVGVALYGKPGTALPGFTPPRTRRRTRSPAASAQLDLFADLR